MERIANYIGFYSHPATVQSNNSETVIGDTFFPPLAENIADGIIYLILIRGNIMHAIYSHIAPFLAVDDAAAMLRIAESMDSFGTYADEASNDGLGEKLPQRFDAAFNYIAHGIEGAGNSDDRRTASHRTNYFRETYAYGEEVRAPGIEPFMQQRDLQDLARKVSGRSEIVPAIVYANLLIPGQELAVHTDVPEFRGANRKVLPQWLLVVMLHSGLFDAWRIPIATCVSWFGSAAGGAFTFYPKGPNGQREAIPAAHNSAIIIDTDQVFHGVERVSQELPDLPPIEKSARLHFLGDNAWQLRDGDRVLGDYDWSKIRYSISWKAYCFEDAAERDLWASGTDDLSDDFIVNRLEEALREQDALTGERPEPTAFARLLVNHFVRFPAADVAAA